jgi:low affinity Fe/Cu permease
MRAGMPVSSLGSSIGTSLESAVASCSGASFARVAGKTAQYMGKPISFVLAAGVVVGWAAVGPIFHYSDTWQLVINTGTTIVTFLMVFLIQNTQNRDTLALQLKLDELILATKEARNVLAGVEELPQEELEAVKEQVAKRARNAPPQGKAPAKSNGAARRRH